MSTVTADCVGVHDVALSLPRVVGARGVERTLPPQLNAEEREALERSAGILKEAANALGV